MNNRERIKAALIGRSGFGKTPFVGQPRVISIDEMAKEAQNLSNYGGDHSAYDGYGDDLIDFGGGRSSFGEAALAQDRKFIITVTNGVASDATFYLNGGLEVRPGDLGLPIADGAFLSVENTALSIVGNPKNYKSFHRFIQDNPTTVIGFQVSSTVATQLQTSVIITNQSPFNTVQDRSIFLGSAQNEGTFQDKIATIVDHFQLDDQTQVKFTIKASSTMTIILYCSAVLNAARALNKKAETANSNVSRRMAYSNLNAKMNTIGGGGLMQIGQGGNS